LSICLQLLWPLSLVDTDYASFYKDKMRDHWAHIFCGFC
jgi:hypothetical protein